MALDYTDTAGALFNRLGRIGKLADTAALTQASLVTYFDELMAEYDSSVASPLQIVTNGTPAKRDSAVSGASAFMAGLVAEANQTVLKMMLADKPSAAGTVATALQEVREQLLTQNKTIQECAVTVAATPDAANSGDGVLVVSERRGDGLVSELAFDETAYVTCTTDAQQGAATSGQEGFVYVGEPRDTSVWSASYPTGPGISTGILAVDATVDAVEDQTTGNLLVNGDFEDFTANLPDYWEAVVGAAGTDFALSTDEYSGTNCLQIVGGATNTNLSQVFSDDANGSGAVLRPSQSYAVSFRAKMSANPSTGILSVGLNDSADAVIADDQGSNSVFTTDLTTLGTSYVSVTGVFRTPKYIPTGTKLSITVSTDIEAGKSLFIDHLAMAPMTATYPGGPSIALFSGADPFVVGDEFSLVTTNDFGGSTRQATFHWLMEKLFGIRSMGILFPSSATPDVADTLITS